MSSEQLKAFLAKVKGDSSLQEKLKAAKSPEDLVGIAKEHGHEFTPDKLDQLSGEELESVSGGTITAMGWKHAGMCAASIYCSKKACLQAPE